MSETTGRDLNGQEQVDATAGTEAAEAKRLAARRRFLLGGAAAVSVIATLGQKDAWAASATVCESIELGYGRGFTANDCDQAAKQELAISALPLKPTDFWLIFVPVGNCDEPEILCYAIASICHIGADVRHWLGWLCRDQPFRRKGATMEEASVKPW